MNTTLHSGSGGSGGSGQQLNYAPYSGYKKTSLFQVFIKKKISSLTCVWWCSMVLILMMIGGNCDAGLPYICK